MAEQSFVERIREGRDDVLSQWVAALRGANLLSGDVTSLRATSTEVLDEVIGALQDGVTPDMGAEAFATAVSHLKRMSAEQAEMGRSPAETAMAVMLLREPLLAVCGEAHAQDVHRLVDRIGLVTFQSFVASRERVISNQQHQLSELSTPVVALHDSILALPLVGTLDSARAQTVMELLLTRSVEMNAKVAIIDITGVPLVDTQVAQYLLKTTAAARLMGLSAIISGVRPQIAQTMVQLGVDFGAVQTTATLAQAFTTALAEVGRRVVSVHEA